MNEECQIVYIDKPEETATGIIEVGIHHYIKEKAGDPAFHRICFALHSADREIVGGVVGDQYWDWVYIDLMWVKDELRGRGYGGRLLAQLEDEARKRGVKYIYLNTFSFQAPGFYQKYGYRIFSKLENFPAGHQRYFLTKQL
jgi:GNAT superfamily N-acetyltransferase